jgi:hypothetical protein
MEICQQRQFDIEHIFTRIMTSYLKRRSWTSSTSNNSFELLGKIPVSDKKLKKR